MNFTAGITPPPGNYSAYWFIFQNSELLIDPVNEVSIPMLDVLSVCPKLESCLFLGQMDGIPCYAGTLPDGSTFENLNPKILRQLYGILEESIFDLAGRAFHLLNWDRESRFCGTCGTATIMAPELLAKNCPACGRTIFPRISPAVIVAIVRDDQLLLASATRFPPDFYSVIAGFVEPGETLEDCLRREVKEEVGITIRNIRYFGSQPWPYPDSLMMAFTAEYDGGEIAIDQKEITAAGWFRADQFPRIPERLSIARRLIDWFLEKGKF